MERGIIMETGRPSEKGFQTACRRIGTDRLISTILNCIKPTMVKTKRNAKALLFLRMMLYKIICWQQMQRHQQQFRQQMQQPLQQKQQKQQPQQLFQQKQQHR